MIHPILINHIPLLTLWATVVATRLGFEWDEALTLGGAVGGLDRDGRDDAAGAPPEEPPQRQRARSRAARRAGTVSVALLHRVVPVACTPEGLRALDRDRPIDPGVIEDYLEDKFGDGLEPVSDAMMQLAGAFEPRRLAHEAYVLFEQFRPEGPAAQVGRGVAGLLRLDAIRRLAVSRAGIH